MMNDFDVEVDASGLKCPLPILRAKKALSAMNSGQILKVMATDPSAVKDFRAFCKQTGNELIDTEESETLSTIFLRRR